MCQRLYRPGYSMPELSTPPGTTSTCWVSFSSTAGSKAVAVRITVTPPPVR